jgi:hypothetical protein
MVGLWACCIGATRLPGQLTRTATLTHLADLPSEFNSTLQSHFSRDKRTAMRHWLTSRIDDQNRIFRRQMISIAILIAALQLGALGLLVRAFLL